MPKYATEWVSTDKLKAGDHIMVHGAVFELTTCREGITPHENRLPGWAWSTKVVDASDTDLLPHEVARYVAQGNKLATFARVKR